MGGMGLTRHSQSTTITQIPRFADRFPLLKILFDPKTMLLNVFSASILVYPGADALKVTVHIYIYIIDILYIYYIILYCILSYYIILYKSTTRTLCHQPAGISYHKPMEVSY